MSKLINTHKYETTFGPAHHTAYKSIQNTY